MGKGRKCVVIEQNTSTRWWEVPDGIWRKASLLRKVRLRRTLQNHVLPVLPVLQDLEALYLRDNLGATPRIVGKSLREVEKDDIAIEAGLYLFDLALSEELIAFTDAKGKKSKPGKKKSKNKDTDTSSSDDQNRIVGCCGMSLSDIRSLYIDTAVGLIRDDVPDKSKSHMKALEAFEVDDIGRIHKFRVLAGFDPLTINEMNDGLKGRIHKLLDSDTEYLSILQQCQPINFLRSLRYALGDDFPEILKWDTSFLLAVAEGLDHNAKITALGKQLMFIEDPGVVRALGTWPMEEIEQAGKGKKKRKYVTRIDLMKKSLGPTFSVLLACSPEIVIEAGEWSDDEVEQMKNYLEHMTTEVIEALKPLPVYQKVSMLDGLWERCGRSFIEEEMKTEAGLAVLTDVITAFQDMFKQGIATKKSKLSDMIAVAKDFEAQIPAQFKKK